MKIGNSFMHSKRIFLSTTFLLLVLLLVLGQIQAQDYGRYHAKNREIEGYLLEENWEKAFEGYRWLDENFEFIFPRDLRIASQVAWEQKDTLGFQYFSQKAFQTGWKWKHVKKQLDDHPEFKDDFGNALRKISKSNPIAEVKFPEVRKQVKKLFIQDQWQALGALFTFSSEKQDRYAERKFAPKAIERTASIKKIISEVGFPGEQLIGNRTWAATILSHYNSISEEFVKKDTTYQGIRDQLWEEWEKGTISPIEFALIENWYHSVSSGRSVASFAILEEEVSQENLPAVNAARKNIGLPSVENYNKLLDLQKRKGMNFFLGTYFGKANPIAIR
jgi:hypothetical protein